MRIPHAVDDPIPLVAARRDNGHALPLRIPYRQHEGDGVLCLVDRVADADVPRRSPVCPQNVDISSQVDQSGGEAPLAQELYDLRRGVTLGDAPQVQRRATPRQTDSAPLVFLRGRNKLPTVRVRQGQGSVQTGLLRQGEGTRLIRVLIDLPQLRDGANERVENAVRELAHLAGLHDSGEHIGRDRQGLAPGAGVDLGKGGILLVEGELIVQVVKEGKGFIQGPPCHFLPARGGDTDHGVHGETIA